MNDIRDLKNRHREGKIQNFGLSSLIQFYLGGVFLFFVVAMFLGHSWINTYSYLKGFLMMISLLIVIPFMLMIKKRYIPIKIKQERVKLLDAKSFILIILVVWILNEIDLIGQLRQFLGLNMEAAGFVVLLPFLGFYFGKTNLISTASIFLVGLLASNGLGWQLNVNHLMLFYSFMGIVFLIGGIIDFKKFSDFYSRS